MDVSTLSDASYLFLAAGIVYALAQTILSIGLFRHSEPDETNEGRVSVVVAARNEAAHLPALLDSLVAQTRRPDEVIIVDDRSTDASAEVIGNYTARYPWIRQIRIEHVPAGMRAKKHALSVGIKASSGDLLCLTDADCVVPEEWVQRMASAFGADTGVVLGAYRPLQHGRTGGLIQTFTRYEKVRALLLTAGATNLGHPWMGSGPSLAYRRSVFEEVGGFDDLHGSLSGDDDLFVHKVRTRTSWRVRVVLDPRALVESEAPDTMAGFLRQRLRHLSAGWHYPLSTRLLLAGYHTVNLLTVISLIIFCLTPAPLFLVAFGLKTSGDLLLFSVGEGHIRRFRDWKWYLPMEFLYVLYVSGLGPLSRVFRVSWKGPESQ